MTEEGFVKADSRNLPNIDMCMVAEFIRTDERFNAAEIKLVKASISSRESYGNHAIGYVSLKREGSSYTIRGKICPEHRVRNKNYSVQVIVNMEEQIIEDVSCEDCAASLGGCKHMLAFILWLQRISLEKSPTEVECYWKKPVLSKVGTSIKSITVEEICGKRQNEEDLPDVSQFRSKILKKAEEKQLDSQLTRMNFVLKDRAPYNLSMHLLTLDYFGSGQSDVHEFLQYASAQCTKENCELVEKKTREQSDCVLWHEIRYGRITASVLLEAARCKTSNGSLVQKLLGASKKFDTIDMERGRNLESEVIKVVEKKLKLKLNRSGLVLIPNFPVFGASPDALGKDFVCEVKCPSSVKVYKNYISNGVIHEKYRAQMNLQMLATGMQKGLFCIADADFENNKKVELHWLDMDSRFINKLISDAMNFWKQHIYTKLKDSALK